MVQPAGRHEKQARPLLNPATLKPMTFEELRPVFCDELVRQELDDTTPILRSPRRSWTSTRCTGPPR